MRLYAITDRRSASRGNPWSLDARTADLREWATRIAVRRGEGIAVVALVRRLAGILFALLRDGTVYEPRRRAPHIVPQPVAA